MGRDIVLIHGMWSRPEVLEPLRRHLAGCGHRVFAPALPGHDQENPPEADWLGKISIAEYVESVERFIDDKKLESPPILIGHSMGGLIAQLVASRRTVGAVVLMNSAGPAGVNHIYPTAAWTTLNVLAMPFFWRRTHRPSFRRARYGLFNRVPAERTREIHESLVPESGRCFFEVVFWFLDPKGTTRVAPETLAAPILILSGGKDRIIKGAVAEKLSRLYPATDTRYYPDNGHWFCEESGRDRIFADIETWIDDRPARLTETPDPTRGSIPTSHHEVSRLPPVRPTGFPAAQPLGLRRFLDGARRVRRRPRENAPPD
ncbi:MAG: alpha/beta fold hydrolase [Verrucomicrobiales bacterium]